ncbi:MAG: hypothetical protein WCT12_15095 [Verrucomicrobiota bacterium]
MQLHDGVEARENPEWAVSVAGGGRQARGQGKAGGGAVLTKTGQKVVALYHRMEQQSHAAIQEGFREFQTLLRP